MGQPDQSKRGKLAYKYKLRIGTKVEEIEKESDKERMKERKEESQNEKKRER